MTIDNAPALTIISACASLFSALCSGYVLWTLDRLFKDVHVRIDSAEKRLSQLERRAMEA
ncbi:MAG: hypothetical protein KGO96_13745 [Elusimicrobia bacterium]|nr:hypothetical protein [Elusimicrobiota bacterium]MDE2426958.1 hypothetical protein [Elusimicrobiota bacterium]